MSRILLYEMNQKDGFFTYPTSSHLSPPSSVSSLHENESTQSSSSNSPLVLLLLISIAVLVFISGLLHLLVRCFLKRPSSPLPPIHQTHQRNRENSHTLQRQLQQLFRQHDSGLDQALIDALPVFFYKDIMGLKEPFDCAVCLSEFADQDELRLLPTCRHAFHISCIDTWLLSNSTCPLCRGTLSSSNLSMEGNHNPVSSFDILRDLSDGFTSDGTEKGETTVTEENGGLKKVLSVRLGKFKSTNVDTREQQQGEISRSNLDARRCYSMDTFQYVECHSDLQVTFSHARDNICTSNTKPNKEKSSNNSSIEEEETDDKKISTRTRGESFSVSKIWLWSKKNRLPTSLGSQMSQPSLSYYKFSNPH